MSAAGSVILLIAFCAGLTATALAAPPIELIASGIIASDQPDRSGLVGTLGDGTPANRLGSFGSGIAYTGRDNCYAAIADRGPNASKYDPAVDNTTGYRSRVELFRIRVDAAAHSLTTELLDTKLLSDETGTPYNGLSTDFVSGQASNYPGHHRFDPEAICISNERRKYYVADEYSPAVREFDVITGQLTHSFELPAKFILERPAATADMEMANNHSGRQPNRGLEGLAITPDGKTLAGILQGPLLQDGALDNQGKRVGVNNRIVTIDVATGKTREYLYQLSNGEKNGVNEILAVNDHQFLVHERDGKAGSKAAFKQLLLIDLAGATDISNVATLPQTGTPVDVKPVAKKPFLDLLDPQFGLASENFPEKTEGLTFGPDLPDGRHLLIVTSDNDFLATQPTRLYAFAIEPSALPGYVAQRFER